MIKRFTLALLCAGLIFVHGFSQTVEDFWQNESGNCLTLTGQENYYLSSSGLSGNYSDTAFTIEAWIYNNGNSYDVLSIGSSDVNSIEFAVDNSYGPFIDLSNGESSIEVKKTNRARQLFVGRWNHVAVTWSNHDTTVCIYINGMLYHKKYVDPFEISYPSDANIYVGSSFGSDDWMNAKIDELRIWNKALTQSQIKANMFNTSKGTESNLIGLYHFDNDDLSAADSSSFGNNLSANNLTTSNFEESGAHIPDKNIGYRELIQNTNWTESETIEDGITWRFNEYDDLFERMQNLSVLEVDPSIADIEFKMVVLPDGASYQKTSEIAEEYGAIAAINGTYWNTSGMINESSFPANEVTNWGAGVYTRVDGQDITPTYLIQSLPNCLFGEPENDDCDYADDCAFAFNNSEGKFNIVNRPKKLQFNESDSSYIHGWTGYTEYENVMSSGPLLVSEDTISYHYRNAYRQWNSGEKPWEWQIGDQPFINIGVKEDGTVVMVTGDGRRTQSVGCGSPQMAQVMKALGCKEALRLDGGGSTTMYIRGKGVVNYPSDNSAYDHAGERSDNSFILVIPKNKKGSGLAAGFKREGKHAIISDEDIISPDSSFALNIWARTDTSFSAFSYQDIVSTHGRNGSTSDREGFFLEWNGASQQLTAGLAQDNGWNSMTTSVDVDSCQWFNIGLTYNAKDSKVYLVINGEAKDSSTVTDPEYGTSNLYIGGSEYYSSNDAFFTIDGFRYWNRFVSADEFKQLQFKKSVGTDDSLKVDIRFDELNSDGTFTNYADNNITVTTDGGFSTSDLELKYAPIGDTIISKYDTIIGIYPGKESASANNIALEGDFSYDTYVLASDLTGESIDITDDAADKTGANKYYIYSPHAAAVTVKIPLSKTGLTLETSDIVLLLNSDDNSTFEATSFIGSVKNDTIVFEDAELETGYYAIGVSGVNFTEGAGQSLILSGSQGITLENDDIDPIVESDEFTLEAWVRYTGSAPTSSAPIFSSNGRINSLSTGLSVEFVSDGSGMIKAAFGNNGSGWTVAYGEQAWEANEWHHVAFVFENDSIRLYEDGNLSDAAKTDGYYENTYKMGIGYSYNYGTYLTGGIDEIRVWKKALSQDEIKETMFSSLTGEEDSIAIYYNFNHDSIGYALCLGGDAINGEFVTTETTLTETSTAAIGVLDDDYKNNISAAWSAVSKSSDESGLEVSPASISTDQNVVFGSNALTGSSSHQLSRSWNIDVNDAEATYSLSFDLVKSLEETPSYMEYFLLYGTDINSLTKIDTTENVADGIVSFDALNLNDGYYTLGWSSSVRDSIVDYLCEGNSYEFGDETITEAGIYSKTFETVDGNDSIIVLTLISSSPVSVDIDETICNGEIYTVGNQSFSEAGTYAITLSTIHGCDSVINLTLSINELDLGISQDGTTLIANTTGASYQWLDCNDNSVIDGATERSYTGTEGVSYAVIVDDGYCSDTSDCVTLTTSSGSSAIANTNATSIEVYPIPAKDELTITSDSYISEINVYSIAGKLIQQYLVDNTSATLNIAELEKGFYMLKAKTGNTIVTKSFIKE